MANRMFRRDSALTLLKESEDRLARALQYIAAGEEGGMGDYFESFDDVNPEFRRTLKKLRGFIASAELPRKER